MLTSSRLLLGLLALAMASCDADPLAARVDSIVDVVRPALFDCPDRAWPGTTERLRTRAQVVFVSEEAGRAFLFNDLSSGPSADPRLTEIDPDSLPADLRSRHYGYGSLNGVPTLGVSLDDAAAHDAFVRGGGTEPWHEWAASVALHEGFHFLSGQTEWPRSGEGSRGASYPARFEPRYLRAALARALLAVVREEDGATLAHAAHWQARYLAEEGEDADRLRETDRLEGGATSFELAGSALGALGCDATDEQLEAVALEHLERFAGEDAPTPTTEPYELGALAGLLLRRSRAMGWEADVESAHTLVEVLLREVEPVEVPDDPVLLTDVREGIDSQNESQAVTIEPFLAQLEDPAFLRIALPNAWSTGSFSTSGFVLLSELPGQPQAILDVAMELVEPASGAEVHVDGALLLMTTSDHTPCGGSDFVYVTTIARTAITGGSGAYSSDSSALRFHDLPMVEVVSGAPSWLCPLGGP